MPTMTATSEDLAAPRLARARWTLNLSLNLSPSLTLNSTLSLALCLAWLVGCSSTPPTPPAAPAPAPVEATPVADNDQPLGARGTVAGRSERLLVYLPAAGDTLAAITKRFLGQADRAWQISDANQRGGALAPWQPVVGMPVIVPLNANAPTGPVGVDATGYQTVPILCYHRFGTGASKMIVSPAQFEAQLDWLARHQFHVLRLSELAGFLAAREPLPQRSVVITIDDGYESVHRHAFPLLKKYGFAATLFMYSDFINVGEGLNWSQMQEMATSGLIDIQAHSKTHRNLIERTAGETDASYRQAIDSELRVPRQVLERKLASLGVRVRHFAYPYGDANELVLDGMQRNRYDLGLTVNPGGNAFFSHPLMLQRTMIYGDHDLDDFRARVQVRKSSQRP
jgi:peptidoglycan/xylan/chitin deacetylase (PgdA/CDA1 family)